LFSPAQLKDPFLFKKKKKERKKKEKVPSGLNQRDGLDL
jgi:hypothetical protein